MLTNTLPLFLLLTLITIASCMPQNDKAIFDPEDPESRGYKRKGSRRPCRGRSAPEGRTFFDWSFSYVDVNYNYNYNINCGGGGGNHHNDVGGGGPNKPILSAIAGNIQNRPPGSGLFGSNGPVSSVQSQVQNIVASGQGLLPQGGIFNGQGLGSLLPQGGIFNGEGLGSLLPQGGLFNGQGISSLFENGLFSGIFDSGPSRPQPGGPQPPRPPPPRPTTTTPKPGVTDPDDIIYNDERPVHEDHDDVFPDQHNRPGQYLVAANPVFGQFVYDLNYRQKPVRQINREINRLVRPWADLLGRR